MSLHTNLRSIDSCKTEISMRNTLCEFPMFTTVVRSRASTVPGSCFAEIEEKLVRVFHSLTNFFIFTQFMTAAAFYPFDFQMEVKLYCIFPMHRFHSLGFLCQKCCISLFFVVFLRFASCTQHFNLFFDIFSLFLVYSACYQVYFRKIPEVLPSF